MNYKQKALDHVRSVCPELMELSFGCEFIEKDSDRKLMYLNKWHSTESCLACWTYDGGYGETVKADVGKIIGHTPHLEHWLRGLKKRPVEYVDTSKTEIRILWKDIVTDYNLTKNGENQSEDFYKAYCEITNCV